LKNERLGYREKGAGLESCDLYLKSKKKLKYEQKTADSYRRK
jgi:hypothetical protein